MQGDSGPKAYNALKSAGYSDIILGDNVLFGCSEEDSYFTSHEFIAVKGDVKVSGIACCGLLIKGCTIRF